MSYRRTACVQARDKYNTSHLLHGYLVCYIAEYLVSSNVMNKALCLWISYVACACMCVFNKFTSPFDLFAVGRYIPTFSCKAQLSRSVVRYASAVP